MEYENNCSVAGGDSGGRGHSCDLLSTNLTTTAIVHNNNIDVLLFKEGVLLSTRKRNESSATLQ